MSTSGNLLLLHVEITKTGTTTLQRALFPKNSDIYFLGKYYEAEKSKGWASKEVFDFLNPIILDNNLRLNINKHKAILRDNIIPAAHPRQIILASQESLGNIPARRYKNMLERVHSVFGSFRVMITIRNPLTWITSEYLQAIRGNFTENRRPWIGKSSYIDLDTWLMKIVLRNNTLDELFSYHANIEEAIKLLGKDNVGVFVFENLVNDPVQYYREIYDFIGIDAFGGLKLTNDIYNRRLTQTQFLNLQRLAHLPIWSKLLLKMNGDRKYRRFVFESGADDGAPVDIVLPSHWERGISDATRPNNRWIAETYELPLGEFGYPM